VSLTYTKPDGTRGTRNNPQDSIEQILPQRLSSLFFFDGEYITQLSEKRSHGEIREAIQNIMGLKIIERSIDHLKTVEARFEDELQDAASSELKSLMDTRSELRGRKEDHEQALESAEQTRDTLISEIGEIKRKLEQIDDSADQNRSARSSKTNCRRSKHVSRRLTTKSRTRSVPRATSLRNARR